MRRDYRRLPAYKNQLLVAGVMLVVLGLGNWVVGAWRVEPYAEYLAQNPGPIERPEDLKSALLEPPDDEREERSVSRAKLEFYELVRSGGRLMVLLGALCLLGGFLTLRTSGNSVRGRSAKVAMRQGNLSP
ncbi:MAG: hypothetical protein ACREQ9_19910 [Candidatus Binatia bacterium]